MKYPLPFAVLVGLLGVSAVQGDPADDLDKLQGTWKVVSLEREGKKKPEDEIKTFKVIIKEDKFILREGDKDFEATLKLDPAKKPRSLDLLVKDGDKLETIKGIYHLEGDDLKICAAGGPESERPRDFATKPRAPVSLVILRRDK